MPAWLTPNVQKAILVVAVVAIWSLWAINWRKAWPVLAAGGWLPTLLIAWATAYFWSLITPRSVTVLGVPLGNLTWQLIAVGVLTGLSLFCGWVQGVYGWEPATISLDPPEDHGHHGHHAHH